MPDWQLAVQWLTNRHPDRRARTRFLREYRLHGNGSTIALAFDMTRRSLAMVCSVSLGLGTLVGAGLTPRLASHGSLFYVTSYAAGANAVVAMIHPVPEPKKKRVAPPPSRVRANPSPRSDTTRDVTGHLGTSIRNG